MKLNWKFLSLFVVVTVVSCTDTNFNGNQQKAPRVREASGDVETIRISCSDAEQSLIKRSVQGNNSKRFIVEAEICHSLQSPDPEYSLNLLFVLDISGSMERNDPYLNGSCGRAKSVEAILEKVRTTIDSSVEVKIGVIGFNHKAFVISEMSNLSSLSSISAEKLCADEGYTNYESSFNLANTMLRNINGRKALYFISDGLPTESSRGKSEAEELGLDSAKNLRQSNTDLTMFSVFLSTNADNSDSRTTVKDPEEYLGRITGNSQNVVLVSKAEELATEISKFKLPDPVVTSIAKPTLTLNASGFDEMDIQLISFEKQQGDSWVLISEKFLPYYELNTTITNQIMIETTSIEGEKITLRLDLDFTLSGG